MDSWFLATTWTDSVQTTISQSGTNTGLRRCKAFPEQWASSTSGDSGSPTPRSRTWLFVKVLFFSSEVAFSMQEKERHTFVNVTKLITFCWNVCGRFPSHPKLTGRKLRKWPRSYKCSCLSTLLVILCDFFVGIFSWVYFKGKNRSIWEVHMFTTSMPFTCQLATY